MRLIIAGGRNFSDWELFKAKTYYFLANSCSITIISGHCMKPKGSKSKDFVVTFIADNGDEVCGADGMAERYAKEYQYKLELYPANWDLGKSAGPIRNQDMVNAKADGLLAYWDGGSKGTKDIIQKAQDKNLKVRKVMYNKNKTHEPPKQ